MTLTDLLVDVNPYAPGCPSVVALAKLRESAQNFSRRTLVVSREVVGTALGAPVDLEALLDDTSLKVVKVLEAYADGVELHSVSRDYLRSRNPGYQTVTGPARMFYQMSETAAFLFPAPTETQQLRMVLAVAPSDTATTLPDELTDSWKDAVVGGALFRICLTPGQSYTSQDMAAYGASLLNDGIQRARIQFNQSFGRDARVTMRPFTRTRNKP